MSAVGIVIDVAEGINQMWALAGDEAKGTLKDQLRNAGFRRVIVKRANSILEGTGRADLKAAKVLLDDPAFLDFVVDPDDPIALAKLDTVRAEKAFAGLSSDRSTEVARSLAMAVRVGVFDGATLSERLLQAKVSQIDATVKSVLTTARSIHAQLEGLTDAMAALAAGLSDDWNRLLDGAPYLAGDIDLRVRYRMASDVTRDTVPRYVPRDIDDPLEAQLRSTIEADVRLIVVAGPVKSGKSRTLLEGMSRILPYDLVLHVRRFPGRDTLGDLIDALGASPPDRRFVVLVEDLLEHLKGGANLADAVARIGGIGLGGIVAATISDDVFSLTDGDLRSMVLADADLRLVTQAALQLPRSASDREIAVLRDRFRAEIAGGWLLDHELGFFAERFASVPQLLLQTSNAVTGLPETSPEKAVLFAACQIATVQSSRSIDREELAERARCIHSYLDPRRTPDLTADDLARAEVWATKRVGSVVAVLVPVPGSTEQLILNDAVLSYWRIEALSSKFAGCQMGSTAAERIGLELYIASQNQEAEAWWLLADSATSLFDVGVLRNEEGRTDAALDAYWQAVAMDEPEVSSMALFNIARIAEESGELSEARSLYGRVVDMEQANAPRAMVNLGWLHAGQGDLAEALGHYRRAIESGDPDQVPRAWLNLGVLYQDLGHVNHAILAYEQAVATGHHDEAPAAMINLANVLEEESPGLSEGLYQEVIASGHDVEAPKAQVNLGLLLVGQGDTSSGLQLLKEVAESANPADADAAHLALASTRYHLGESTLAVEGLERLSSSGVGEVASKAAILLGSIRKENGDLSGAAVAFKRAVAAGDRSLKPLAAMQLATVLDALDDVPGEIEAYDVAIAWGSPEIQAGAKFDRAITLIDSGDVNAGIKDYQEVIEVGHPEHSPQAALNLGNLHLRRGDFGHARIAYERALEYEGFEKLPITYLNLGDTAFHLDEVELAREWWERAVASADPQAAPLATNRLSNLE